MRNAYCSVVGINLLGDNSGGKTCFIGNTKNNLYNQRNAIIVLYLAPQETLVLQK